jgi:hypothetical protein
MATQGTAPAPVTGATPAPPRQSPRIKLPSQFWQGLVTILFFFLLVRNGMLATPQHALLWSFGLMTAYCAVLEWWIMKDSLGILVNERNLMSLSRLQTVAWTIVIFSGFLVIAMQRIHAGHDKFPDPLNITVDPKLWAVLGISFGSLIGTPMVLNGKKDQAPTDKALQSASRALSEDASEIAKTSQGTLYSNPNPTDAAIADIFHGDEIGNTAKVDIAKLQMFFFTIALVLAYACTLYNALGGTTPDFTQLPVLSANTVTLLGISHAGYLTSKAVDHTQTQS